MNKQRHTAKKRRVSGKKRTTIVNRRRFNTAIFAAVALVIVSVIFVTAVAHSSNTEDTTASAVNYTALSSGALSAATPEPIINELKQLVTEKLSGAEGEWSVYVKNLSTGESFDIGNRKMPSASLIKLFIMAAVYSDIESGTLEESGYINSSLNVMITVSDNDSANYLVEQLGGGDFDSGLAKVNAIADSLDCADTQQQLDIQSTRPVPVEGYNWTSVCDCGVILESIYRHDCVSAESSDKMMNLLRLQQLTEKIPRYLPDYVLVANKTGELLNAEYDAAIVFSPNCDYIICMASGEVEDTEAATDVIAETSLLVYEWFNR